MKKTLLFSVFLLITGIAKLQAQCTASNLSVVIKNVVGGASGCQVTLDISFEADINNGNKFAFIHLWETAPVNHYPNLTYVKAPTAADLANAIATLVIENPGKSTATLYSQYPADPSVPVKYTGVNFSRSGNVYSMTNVVINFSTCEVPVTVKGDVWASQSDLSQTVHCASDGIITILFNNPVITGYKQCASPRLLNLTFENDHTTLSETVVTSVYIDFNSNGIVDAGDIDITASLSPAIPNPMFMPANSQQTFVNMSYMPYSVEAIYHDKPIIVVANATAPGAATVTITKNGINYTGTCKLLPVNFHSFTASRENSKVKLKWETASEQNNSGFVIERKTDGNWSPIASLPTNAPGGNSNSVLKYSYEDINKSTTMSLYRLKQVDFNGTFTYSEIRTVAGEEQMQRMVVYPNPSGDGNVNVILEKGGSKNIFLMDMSGRIVRQWNKATTNTLQINNLLPGMYSLKVTNIESGTQSFEKILISRR